ncbi:MAG TPA: L,D-transpeptidase family protein [Allosphingosinicella sp.]|jgi:murein L,D-transpeptidase YcbB/YkuD
MAAAAFSAALSGCGSESPRAPGEPAARPQRAAQAPVVVSPEVAKAYAARGHRPLWVTQQGVRPEAKAFLHRLATADVEGLDPALYGVPEIEAAIAAAASDRAALARADLLLTRAYAAYLKDLHRPARGMRYIDDGIAPEPVNVATAIAQGKTGQAARLNPLYEALRSAAVTWRRTQPAAPPRQQALVQANLERARAIPAHPGRYIIVDTGSARLWMVEGEKVIGPMRVIVGKPNMQTPPIAGLIRYVTLNPYWNVPPDLARERARRVLREGTGFLAAERIEVLSDWGDSPLVMKLSQVDWRAAAAGKIKLRMRQLPGGANVMGAMKFMMPNELGIYLHDFPNKPLFARSERAISSGCVRVEDAPRLAAWLFGGAAPKPRGNAPEQEVDLPEPVPVYLTYLTVLPAKGGGLVFGNDPYRRDPAALGALERKPSA